jgi:hypothetical protein
VHNKNNKIISNSINTPQVSSGPALKRMSNSFKLKEIHISKMIDLKKGHKRSKFRISFCNKIYLSLITPITDLFCKNYHDNNPQRATFKDLEDKIFHFLDVPEIVCYFITLLKTQCLLVKYLGVQDEEVFYKKQMNYVRNRELDDYIRSYFDEIDFKED